MAYGLGWQMGMLGDVEDVGHGGTQQGTSAMMLIAPAARAGVAVLTNSDAASAPSLATEVLRILLGRPEHLHHEIAVDPTVLDVYQGLYQSSDFKLDIVRDGNRLVAQAGDQRFPLSAETPREFFPAVPDTHIVFVVDRTGRATDLILRQGGTDLYAHRRE
jgi:hypothetical protein